MCASIAAFGIDLGSEATFLVSSQADIVRNELGGHSSGSLVAFSGAERVIGEAAVGQAGTNPKSTVSQLHQLLGSSCETFDSLPLSNHYGFKRTEVDGKLNIQVQFGDGNAEKLFGIESIVSMLLAKLKRLAQTQLEGQGADQNVCFAFGIPSWYGPTEKRALKDATVIAGLKNNSIPKGVLFVESAQALSHVLAKKHPVLEGEKPRSHVVIDMGASHATVLCCKIHPFGFAPNGLDFEVVSVRCDRSCGVANIDALLFELMRKKAQEKLPSSINLAEAGSKAGARLLRGVDRIRKLLGTMSAAEVTIENIAEDCDVAISVSRTELAEIASPIVQRIKKMLGEVIESSKVTEKFASFEILGGGTRIPVIQEAIAEVAQDPDLVFGQKLDSSAIAFGSALLMKALLSHSEPKETLQKDETIVKKEDEEGGAEGVGGGTPSTTDVTLEFLNLSMSGDADGLPEEELEELKRQEESMFEADQVLALISAQKNEIESYILTMRSAPHQTHGDSINVSELEKFLSEAEDWSYSDEAYSADAATVTNKLTTLKKDVETLCAEYFEAVRADKAAKEKEMEEEALKAEQEKFESGEDDDKAEKDNRRLTKAERMKKVMKHKETGTELFKDKNFVHATKHYKDALTHCTKFFDLSAADEEEVKAVKLTLYLNLAMCWTKLDNLDQVFKCCSDALILAPTSPKALYRRAMVYEKRKDFEKAKKDLLLANKQPGSEGDSAIATLLKRVEIQIKKEKEKEKKMYGKMFS